MFRPSTGGWYILKSSEFYTTSRSVSWGLSTDVPMQGDFDGDGRTDPTLFRSLTRAISLVQWGNSTDVAIGKRP